jgi:ASPM-SPD-2-Hydin domain-containing protein/HYDIN/CFA65/VesB family protein
VIGTGVGSTVSLTNVTISGNTAVNGTGIDNKAGSTVALLNVTITDNIATPPANIGGVRNAGIVNAKNTIIANNTPINCSAPLTSLGNNLSNAAGCFGGLGDIVAAAPLLGTLANNGGPLQTVALLPGSPAIDAAAAAAGVCPGKDARGVTRPFAGLPPAAAQCDIGAFEFRPQQISVTLPPPFDFGSVLVGSTVPHTITLTNAGDGPLILQTIAPPAAPFSFTADGCSGRTITQIPLPPTSCAVTIGFAPTVAGAAAGSFIISSNDPVTPAVSFALSGTGSPTAVPSVSVTDSIPPADDHSLPFGSVAVGNSADATVTIANTGTANLVLGTIASADPLAGSFSITSNTCSGATIAPSATCTLSIRFAPTTDGPASDTFDIPTNVAGLASVTMAVSGTGGVATAVTGGNNPPTNPVLVSPENGQTGVATTFTFVWNKSSDPDGDAITYHFQNCTDENFTTGCTNSDVQAAAPSRLLYAGLGSFGAGIVLIGFVAGSGLKRSKKTMLVITLLLLAGGLFMSCTRTKTETVQVPAPGTTAGQISNIVRDLAPNTTYHWKVAADDGKGGLSSSEVRSYTTAP